MRRQLTVLALAVAALVGGWAATADAHPRGGVSIRIGGGGFYGGYGYGGYGFPGRGYYPGYSLYTYPSYGGFYGGYPAYGGYYPSYGYGYPVYGAYPGCGW
jgi:hypothetical protein